MILSDTGPLVALINRNDPHHLECKSALEQLPAEPLLVVWPCFVEAMYLLQRCGYRAQEVAWQMVLSGHMMLHAPTDAEVRRMAQLMEKYRDVPMDLADAAAMAAAEQMGMRRIFSLDSDFNIYGTSDGIALQIVP